MRGNRAIVSIALLEFKINVENSDLNPRVMCTSKSNKKTGEPS